jgi:DNA relaxase NicK
MYFDEGTEWHPGVLFSQGHSAGIVMVDLQGSRLATMKPVEALELTGKIMMLGFRCTRIDLAVDHVMQEIDLYEHALASCKAKELCIMRTYEPDEAYKVDGTPIKKLLKLGQRESEVCARIYDKGLETKLLPVGQWERFEVEIKRDRANEVCMNLVAEGDEYNKLLWKYVIGSIDFRICNGRSERKRRPLVSWWANYIGQIAPKRIKPVPRESSLELWVEWFRTAAGRRVLQLAEIMDITPHELFGQLIDGLKPAKSIVPATVEARALAQAQK